MKKNFLLVIFVMAIAASACSHNTVMVKNPPPGQTKKSSAPGQVKKQTGSLSAKPYAPGQQKKKH
jgi:hypothetical protein